MVNANYSMNQLLWTGSSAWTVNNSGGSIISLFDNGGTQAKIENQSSGLVTINAPIAFAATAGTNRGEINAINGDITFGSGGTITVSGSAVNELHFYGSGRTIAINSVLTAGARKLIIGPSVTDNNTVILNAANSYSGNTEVNVGTAQVGNNTGLGTSAVFLGNGGATFANLNSSLLLNTSGLTVANNITTNKADTGGGLGSGTRTIGGTFTTGTSTFSGTLSLNGGAILTAGNGGTVNFNGIIQNGSDTGNVSRDLTVTGTGATVVLAGANTYTGKTSVTGGATLSLNADTRLGTAPGAAVADQFSLDGGTLRITAGAQTLNATRGITLGASGGTLDTSTIAGSGITTTIGGVIAGNGPLTLKSTGSMAANGGGDGGLGIKLNQATNTFTGDVTLTAGLVSYAHNLSFGDAANKIILNGGGLLDPNTNIALARDIQVLAGGGTFRGYGSLNATWSGAITGSGSINRTDGGTLTHSGDLSGFSGTYNVQGGTTQLTGTAATIGGNWSVASGTVLTLNGTATQALNGSITGTGSATLNVNSSSALTLGGATSMPTGTFTVNGQATFGSGSSVNMTTGSFQINGTGIATIGAGATLNADNINLTGTTSNQLNIEAGATVTTKYLNIGNAANNSGRVVQTGGNVTVTTGGTGMRIGHWNNGVNAGSLYNLSGGTLDASAITVTIGHDGQGDMIVGGGVGTANFKALGIQLDANGNGGGSGLGDMTLTVSTNGTVEVGNINAAAAGDRVILNGGTVRAVANSSWNSVINANTATTSTLDAGNFAVNLTNNLTGTGTIALTAGTGSISFNTNGSQTISAPLSGSLNLVKTGTGTTTLAGTDTFGGSFTVNDGRLNLSGNTSAAVSVSATKTLGGEGTTTGALTLTGANLNIDAASAGMLTVGALTLSGTNTLRFDTGAAVGPINVLTYTGALTGAFGTDLVYDTANTAKYRTAPAFTDTAGVVTLDLGAKNLTWNGTSGGQWDVKTSSRWNASEVDQFAWGDAVTFDNTGVATTIAITGEVQPSAITVTGTQNYTINGGTGNFIGGVGALTKSGASTFTLNAPNTFTGGVSVTAGTLQVGDGSNNTATVGTGAASISSGASLVFFRNSSPTISNVILGSGTLAFQGTGASEQSSYAITGNNSAFSGTMEARNGARVILDSTNDVGSSAIVVNSGGQIYLSNATTYSNAVTLNGIGWTEAAGNLGAVRFETGATLSGTVTLAGDTRLTTFSGASGTVSGVITDGASAFGITKTGTGTLTLTNANTYDGPTTVSAGVLLLNNANAAPGGIGATGGLSNLTLNGGVLGLGNGNLSRALGTGVDQVQLATTAGFAAYTADRTVNFGGANAAVTWGSGGFAPTTLVLSSAAATHNLILSNPIALGSVARTVQVDNGTGATDGQFSGILSGTGGSLIKSGTGTLALSATNTYTGGTILSAGAINVLNASSLGSASVVFGDGNTGANTTSLYLDTNRTAFANQVVVSANGSGTATLGSRASVTGSGDNNNFTNIVLQRNVTFDSNAADRTDYRNITGAGNITITGVGRTLLGGTNTFTGNVTVSVGIGGNLQLGAATAGNQNFIPDTASLTVNDTASNTVAEFRLSVGGETIAGLNGNGTVSVNSINSILTVGSGNVGGTFSGVMENATNTLGLTKIGTGVQILSGANTYTGTTTVSGGLLRLDGATSLSGGLGATGGTSALTITDGQLGLGQGDFSRALGTGAAQVQITGGASGFSAHGAARTVNFGGAAAGITWGSASFAPATLVLSHSTSDNTLTIANPIDLGAATARTVQVDNGSAAIDAALSGALTNTGSLTKTGLGTLSLSGANTFSGATTLSAGNLRLDYATQNNSKLADAAALTFGAGATSLELSGGTHTEVVASTTLSAGANALVTRSSGTSVLQLGTVTRNANATISFGAASIATVNNTNTNGILGAWATLGNDWATNSTNAANGPVTAYTGYTDVTRLSSGTKAIANSAANNVRVTEGTGTAANLTLAAATTNINTLNMTATGGATIVDMSTNTLRLGVPGGILAGSGVSALTFGTAVNQGFLSAGGSTADTAGELIFTNNSSNTITVNSPLINNGTGAVSLLKTGTGLVTLAGSTGGTYSGGTTINGGELRVSTPSTAATYTTLGTGAVTVNSGTTLRFFAGSTSVALTFANALNLNGATLINEDANHTLSGAVALTGANTVNGVWSAKNLVLSGIISGAGSISKTGAADLTLSGANTFSGGLTLASGGGKLNLNNATALGTGVFTVNGSSFDNTSASALTLTSNIAQVWGGDFTFTGTQSLNLGTGSVALGASRTVTTSANTLTVGGAISGIGFGLTKAGAGTLALAGNNTYTGSTTVSAGRLTVTGTNLSGITVTGATLSGTGSTAGNLTTNAGSSIALNTAAPTSALTASGTVTFAGATSTSFDTPPSLTLGTTAYTVVTYGTLASSGLANLTGPAGYRSALVNDTANKKVLLNVTTATRTWNRTSPGNWDILGATNWAEGDTLFATGDAVIFSDTATNGAVTLTGTVLPSSVSVNNSATDYTFSGAGAIGGTTSLTKSGTGTLTVSTANTYTGSTIVNTGTVNLSIGGGTGAIRGPLTIGSGATVNLTVANALGTTQGQRVGNVTINGSTLNVTNTGTNSVTSQSITLTGGSLIGVASSKFDLRNNGAGNTSLITNASPTTATISVPTLGMPRNDTTITTALGTTPSGIDLLITSAIVNDAGSGGAGAGTSSIIKAGPGTLSLTGVNTYTGATTINTGVLNIQNSSALGDVAAGTTVASGAALQLANNISLGTEALGLSGTGVSNDGALRNLSGTNSYAGAVTLNAATRINSDAGTMTLSGGISGAAQNLTVGGAGNTTASGVIGTTTGSMTKDGAGTLILSGANTYTGATTITTGVLNIQNSSALGTIAAGTTVASGAALQLANNISVGAEALGLSGTGVSNDGALRNISGTNSFAGAVTLNAATRINSDTGTMTLSGGISGAAQNLTVGGAGTTTISGIIGTTTGSLTKDGAGTLILTATNTYTGGTNIAAGTLGFASGSLGTTGSIAFTGSSTLRWETVNTQDVSARLAAIGTGITATLDTNGNDVAFASVLSGAGSLAKTGSGTLTLNGVNTYAGGTTINGGEAKAGNANAFGGGTITLSTGGTLNLNSLNLPNTITNNGGTITGGAVSGTITQDGGTLSGSFSGTVNASGNIAGSSTITGTLNSGTATFTGAVTVNNGGFAKGNGNFSGGLTINSGGTLSPGNSPGTTSAGNTVWNSGGNYDYELNSVVVGQGTNQDFLSITGTLTINATSGDKFNLKVISLTGLNTAGAVPDFASAHPGYTWTIVTASGGITGFDADAINIDLTNFVNPNVLADWQVQNIGNNINLVYVPEPSTYAAFAGLAVLGLAWNRRRQRRLAAQKTLA